jgi:hypothetical protein
MTQNGNKQTKTKENESKPNQTKRNEVNPLSYEIPMPDEEAFAMCTEWQREKRMNKGVTAIGLRIQGGMIMVRVLPDVVK